MRYAIGFLDRLNSELARIGRPDIEVDGGDEAIITLTARDGSWRGPAPTLATLLDSCPDGFASRGDFWQRLAVQTGSDLHIAPGGA